MGASITSWADEMRSNGYSEQVMPAIFVGHGSPMNAIEENDFTRSLQATGKALPKPNAILCISAHWLTNGTFVNASPKPKMIYDMYGFPEELYQVNYPANGAPELAKQTKDIVETVDVKLDYDWGFDHGCWSVLRHLFPNADIPVYEMSIDYNQPMQYHYNLARYLKKLRENGVLIVGSGNITHNLRLVNMADINAKPVDWALEFDSNIKILLNESNHQGLIDFHKIGSSARYAVPEPSHYIPLIYIAALQSRQDNLSYFYEDFHYGSLSMRCVKIG